MELFPEDGWLSFLAVFIPQSIFAEPLIVRHIRGETEEDSRRLKIGLNRAIADGDFDKLFLKHFKTVVKALKNRGMIELKNPFLSSETPLNRRELWRLPRSLQAY